jgi:hypothetical protein
MSDPAKPPSRIKNAAAERLAIPAPTKYAFAILPCSFDEDKLESASPLHYEEDVPLAVEIVEAVVAH